MLRQTTRRKAVQQYLQRSSAQLYLPWLCPAVYSPSTRQTRQARSLIRPSATPRASSPAPPLSRKPQSRELASAAGDIFSYPVDDQYVPFSAGDPFIASPFSSPQLYDTSNLLMLDTVLPIEQTRLRRGAKSGSGGLGSELEATFQACLHVGRFERAESLLERLTQAYANDRDQLTYLNHQYIRNLLRSIEFGKKEEEYKQLTNWIIKGMKKAGVESDGVSYAALLKGAFIMLEGPKLHKVVKSYWKAAEAQQVDADVIGANILQDADLGMLSEICPTQIKNFATRFGDIEETEDIQNSTDFETEIDINPSVDVATAQSLTSSPVRGVAQRGLGLKYLQDSMTTLLESSDIEAKSWMSEEEKNINLTMERQKQLETQAIDAAMRRWKEERMSEHGIETKKMGAYLWDWQKLLTEKIEEELKLVDEAESKTRKASDDQLKLEYGPFLRLVAPDRLAATTIITFLGLMSKTGAALEMRLSNMMVQVGRAVHMEAIVSSLAQEEAKKGEADRHNKSISKFIEYTTRNDGNQALWKIQRRIRQESMKLNPKSALSPSLWSNVTYAKVGSILTQLFMDVAKVSVKVQDPETSQTIAAFQPAFQRNDKYELGKRVAFLTMHEKVERTLRRDPSPAFIVKHLPMLCHPKPWKGFLDGGYYQTSVPVIRVKSAVDRQRRYVDVAASRGDLDNFFAGLDVLGRTSWKVNPDVYKVMLEAWNSGEAIANIAPAEFNEPAPQRPSDWSDISARKRWYNDQRKWENLKSGLHSERCFQNLQMEMAQNYLNEKFYLPHNADFRGRAYPIAPYLNQMGADNARGLLLFGEGRELGSEGLRWLKIHLANVFGYDKASLKERELFAMEHLADIRDSVENPLTGQRWWLKAEDPWQCLATCFELQHALDSPEPEKYLSHLPVHQDGSCNGLQHYAALGGDKAGAQQVNLEPGDRPSDVYTGVAELIKAEITREAAQGSKIAKLLDGKIKRKIVKQTVMTNVYGVTFIGAMRQVKKQLEAHYPEMNKAGSVPISGVCAAYIARKIFTALGEIFNGAHHIQFWLGDCASRISASLTSAQVEVICAKADSSYIKQDSKIMKSLKKTPEKHFRSGVTWTTPLNLTVVQPYRHVESTMVSTAFQQVAIKDPQETDIVDKRRQLQAFPPNFVHSLDATHMILSALRCNSAGLSFSAVHDSFWTHAADINEMNRLLRDAFVQMHSEDVIGRLATEFKLRYSRHVFRASVKPGNNPLRKRVEEWRRDFKRDNRITSKENMSLAELRLEVKRQALLRSEDPEEVKRGQQMVTPASIFDECEGEQYLLTQKSLGQTALGHIPETSAEEIIKTALESETIDPLADVAVEPETTSETNYVNVNNSRTLREIVLADLGLPKDKVLSEDETLVVEMMEEHRIEQRQSEERKKAAKGKGNASSMYIWLPLRFAEVPKRGEWDVKRLKESDYFFS